MKEIIYIYIEIFVFQTKYFVIINLIYIFNIYLFVSKFHYDFHVRSLFSGCNNTAINLA